MLKARSVDVRRTLSEIAAETETILNGGGLSIERVISLSPYYPDHAALLGKWQDHA
jgi:fibrillarin-like rRNA methylase